MLYKASYFVSIDYFLQSPPMIVGNLYILDKKPVLDDEGNIIEEKEELIINLPFPKFAFSEIPNKTEEGIKEYVKTTIEQYINANLDKINELKQLKDLGLYKDTSEIKLNENIVEGTINN